MNRFKLKENQTSVRQEILAGLTSFFAISYIIVVNPLILAEAGVPAELSVFATILAAGLGSILMGVWGNAPLVLAPGMGENAFFTYTIVKSMGLDWREALAVVAVSSIVFVAVSFTNVSNVLANAIPNTLKQGITAGIGLFLVTIGLENGGIIVDGGADTFITLGNLADPLVLLALIGLLFTGILYLRNVRGSFFIGIVIITVLSLITGVHQPEVVTFSLDNAAAYPDIVGAFDFSGIVSFKFLLAVFSLTMLLIFETIGMFEGILEDKTKFTSAFKVTAVMAFASSLLGTSPTIPTAESASGVKEGGKTGLTAITAGVLFLLALVFTPLLAFIPSAALAPVIILTGAIMMENLKYVPFEDFSEWFPAFLIVVMIPFTSSIVTGMAFGFVAYPIFKLAKGEFHKIQKPMQVVSLLFLLTLIATGSL